MAVPGSVVGVGKLITPGGQQGVKGDPGASAINFASQRVLFDDFLGYGTSVAALANNVWFGSTPWYTVIVGTGALIQFDDQYATSTAKASGCLLINTGTTATGGGFIYAAALPPGQQALEMDFRVIAPTAPTNAQNYQLNFGLADLSGTRYMQFDIRFATTAVVTGKVANAGTVSTTATATFVAGSFHRYQMLINSAWNSVSFYLDGTQVGAAVTTNIPTTSVLYPYYGIAKLAGTTAVTADIDQFYLNYAYTS